MIAHDPGTTEVRPFEMFRSLTAEVRWNVRGGLFDVLQRTVEEFRVGDTVYRTRSPLLATFYPRTRGSDGELAMTPCSLRIVGAGKAFDEAQRDWNEQFHVRFQTLLAKRPWEMPAEERDEWGQIEFLVDVAAYRRETPSRLRQIGSVSQRRPTGGEPRALPNQIRWESGKVEDVRLDLAPPEFASYFAGKRFEAVVLRDPVTGHLLRILDVIPLPPLPKDATCDALWDSVPTSRDLPAVEWEKYD
jgi:hypothetical protein